MLASEEMFAIFALPGKSLFHLILIAHISYWIVIGESAQQKKYKVVSLENPIAKVLLHERYSVALLRAVVAGMFKAFSYKGRSCLKVSILVSRYMLFEQFTSERCPMMYAPAGSVIDFVPRFHEFMTETLYVSNKLQYCFPRSLFNQIRSSITHWAAFVLVLVNVIDRVPSSPMAILTLLPYCNFATWYLFEPPSPYPVTTKSPNSWPTPPCMLSKKQK